MNYKRNIIAFLAKKQLQFFYQKIHWLSLRLMNYGAANSPKESGEEWLLKFLLKNKDENIIVFDVGANVGQYANLVDSILKKEVHIHSFEPSKVTYESMVKNTKAIPNMVVNNLGIGEKEEELTIYYKNEGSVLASMYNDKGSSKSEVISISTLDNYCNEKYINHIDLLKIDVEGFEYYALKGAMNLIESNSVDMIQFEFGGQQISSKHFLRDFIELLPDFKLYRLVQNGLIPIRNHPQFEVFLTTNYVAIRRDSKLIV